MSNLPNRGGLYAITDTALLAERGLVSAAEAVLAGGARVLQYRDKGTDQPRRYQEAAALQGLCAQYQVPLLINDDVALALAVGAAGVHLGEQDGSVGDARSRLGAQAIIGVSCYNELQRVRQAQADGADYVALGSFFRSATKPTARVAELGLLPAAKALCNLPLVAIGGITPDRGATLIAAGADWLAVIQGVFAQADVQGAAAQFAALFPQV